MVHPEKVVGVVGHLLIVLELFLLVLVVEVEQAIQTLLPVVLVAVRQGVMVVDKLAVVKV